MTRHWLLVRAALVVCTMAVLGLRQVDADVFEKPFRLKAADGFIDTGESWGHSGPCLADVDGDGARDLVVGDFSGKFRVYRNLGTNNRPSYAASTYLQAGGTDAKVHVY